MADVFEPLREHFGHLSFRPRPGRGGLQAALSLADRQAIVEILRDTKKDLPPCFQAVTR